MKRRYYIPERLRWSIEPTAEESARLQRVITSIIRRAVESVAGETSEIVLSDFELQEDIRETFSSSRYRPEHSTYAIPSYQEGGTPKEVPVAQEKLPEASTQSDGGKVEEAKISLSSRLEGATKRLKSRDFISSLRQQLPDIYTRNATEGTKAMVDSIWSDILGFRDVEVKTLTNKEKRQIKSIRTSLQKRVEDELVAFFKRMEIGLAARRSELETLITGQYRLRPSWHVNDLTELLWLTWLHFGPLKVLGEKSRSHAAKTWHTLRREIDRAVRAHLHGVASKEAIAKLDPDEKAAVKAEVLRSQSYQHDMDLLTDTVLTQISGNTIQRNDAAWQALRQRITVLLIAAETEVIREKIHPSWLKSFNEQVWGYARNLYVNNMTKPIWSFFQEDIVPFNFLGHSTGKDSGVHKTVARVLELVERSALRLAGVQGVAELTDRPRGFGFRFEPQREAENFGTRLSFHASGRALDLRAKTNPHFKGVAMQLIGTLGSEEFVGLSVPRATLIRLANTIRPLIDRRAAVITKLARLAKGTPERQKAEMELAGIERDLDEINKSSLVTKLREQATEAHTKLNEAEADFQKRWNELTGGTGKAQNINFNELHKQIQGLLLFTKSFPSLSKFDQKSLQNLEHLLSAPEVLTAEKKPRKGIQAAQRKRDQLLREVANVASSGITDLPAWMVRAFTEQGWSWGGTWQSAKDTMHFDYMGPVDGVKT